MKVRILLMVVVCALVFGGNAGAFGLPGFAKGSSKAPAVDPDAYLLKAKTSELLVNKSASLLCGLVASKEEQAKIEEISNQLRTCTKPEEQKALMQQKRDSELAAVAKAGSSAKLSEDAAKWDTLKKKQGAAALFNLALGAKIAAELVPEGQNLAKSMQSNPMMVAKAGSILESVKTMGGIASGTGTVFDRFTACVFSGKN